MTDAGCQADVLVAGSRNRQAGDRRVWRRAHARQAKHDDQRAHHRNCHAPILTRRAPNAIDSRPIRWQFSQTPGERSRVARPVNAFTNLKPGSSARELSPEHPRVQSRHFQVRPAVSDPVSGHPKQGSHDPKPGSGNPEPVPRNRWHESAHPEVRSRDPKPCSGDLRVVSGD